MNWKVIVIALLVFGMVVSGCVSKEETVTKDVQTSIESLNTSLAELDDLNNTLNLDGLDLPRLPEEYSAT